jgi:Primase zinc finger
MSVNSASQMVKLGVSADFAICKGRRKDGMACSMVINKYVHNVKVISCRQLETNKVSYIPYKTGNISCAL